MQNTNQPQKENYCENQCATCKCKVPLILGAIIFSLLMLALGVFLGRTYFVQYRIREPSFVVPTCPPTGKSTATNSATLDSLVNWKTYTNNTYDYSIQYPPGWNLKEVASTGNRLQSILMTGILESKPSLSTDILIRVETKQNNCYQTDIKCYLPSEMEKITVGALSVYQVDSYIPAEGGENKTQKLRVAMFEKNGKLYSISQQRSVSSEKELLQEFSQILSTFKFTEK